MNVPAIAPNTSPSASVTSEQVDESDGIISDPAPDSASPHLSANQAKSVVDAQGLGELTKGSPGVQLRSVSFHTFIGGSRSTPVLAWVLTYPGVPRLSSGGLNIKGGTLPIESPPPVSRSICTLVVYVVDATGKFNQANESCSPS
jgi:hypothetical protein